MGIRLIPVRILKASDRPGALPVGAITEFAAYAAIHLVNTGWAEHLTPEEYSTYHYGKA